MMQQPGDPRPLEYRGDADASGGRLATRLVVVVVWAVGLASWTLWTAALVYGFFRVFG
jgi:hypothetical protein